MHVMRRPPMGPRLPTAYYWLQYKNITVNPVFYGIKNILTFIEFKRRYPCNKTTNMNYDKAYLSNIKLCFLFTGYQIELK